MKTITTITFTLFAIILISLPASAYWPTTVEENLVISADPNLYEWAPATVPLAGDKIGVFFKLEGPGVCCQIIDRFGELVLETPQPLLPGLDSTHHGAPHAIPDGAGGAMICCAEGPEYSTLIPGIFAQRVDSLGNLMWGDEGIRIFQIYEGTYDICPDGEGGMYLGIIPDDPAGVEGQFWLQRVDEVGNLLFGDSGIVAIYNPNGVIHPHIASDGASGCYLVWEESQGLYAQRFDGSGSAIWPSNLQIENQGPSWHFEIIPDGENGLIVQTNYGADWNTLRRISPTGSFLWTRTHLTWYQDAQIMPGEPGFFYAGFTFFGGMVYGQKIDLQGNPHWTSWPQDYGALMYNRQPNWYCEGGSNWHFYYPYFYAIFGTGNSVNYIQQLVVQRLDSLGNPAMGENGVVLTTEHFAGGFMYLHAVPDNEGVVGVFSIYYGSAFYDVYAKRCYFDGTLGGALHLLVNLTPHNPPIQIPPSGGSFIYDISIEDTYSVAGIFDAWIEAILPGGGSVEILHREGLTIDSNSTIIRTDLQQFIPYRAPAGEYNYTAYVGNHEYNSVWAEDSFTFEKLPGLDSGRASLAGMTSNSEAAGMTDEGWMLEGFFDGSLEGSIESASAKSPAGLSRLSAFPNPFNDETEISFTLFESSEIELSVYDISGRQVVRLAQGFRNPGSHTVNWKADAISSGIYFVRLSAGNHSHIIKVGLVK